MANAGNMTASPPAPVVVPIRDGGAFDLESMVSLETIRHHTKTEDIPSVTDTQLDLYRRAAFEAAERYTGLLLSKNQRFEEPVKPPRRYVEDARMKVTHRLRYALAEPQVFVTGPGIREIIQATVGDTTVSIPMQKFGHMLFDCCRPCSDGPGAVKVMYLAGYADASQVPAGIILGVLKFVAWSVENPGDVMKTVDQRTSLADNFLKGSNDGAWASGAIDEWRRYVNEI
jgi:hypothetical protein